MPASLESLVEALMHARKIGGGTDTNAQGLMANLLSLSPYKFESLDPDPRDDKKGWYRGGEVTVADKDPRVLLHELLHHATDADMKDDPFIKRLGEKPFGNADPPTLLHALISGISAARYPRYQVKGVTDRSGLDILEDEFRQVVIDAMVRRRHQQGLEALK